MSAFRQDPPPSAGEIPDPWSLSEKDRELILQRHRANRLPFAVALCLFRAKGRFPDRLDEVSARELRHVAGQLNITAPKLNDLRVHSRTLARIRVEIRESERFRKSRSSDLNELSAWLVENAVREKRSIELLTDTVYARCEEQRIQPPSDDRVERVVRKAIWDYEQRFCQQVEVQLPSDVKAALELLLQIDHSMTSDDPEDVDACTRLMRLRRSPGKPGLNSIREEITKLSMLRHVGLPPVFGSALPHEVTRYNRRAEVEAPHELRRHPPPLKHTILAAFVFLRSRTVTDNLVDLLIDTVHKIASSAEDKANKEFSGLDGTTISEKLKILYSICDATVDNPDGSAREVVYPAAGGSEVVLRLALEGKQGKGAFKAAIRKYIKSSYAIHYRQVLPVLLDMLEFRSNNSQFQPIIHALGLVRKYAGTNMKHFPKEELVPVNGIVRDSWRDVVMEAVPGMKTPRVNRAAYEICVLIALRKALRCKEIWVVGADRYRNPEEDLPHDFEENREAYYKALNLPLDPDSFVTHLVNDLFQALSQFDKDIPKNPDVRITARNGTGWFRVKSLRAQEPPINMARLKAEIQAELDIISLMDVVKETDLRLNFSKFLRSPTAYEALARSILRPRLLMCIHGFATNTGLQRLAYEHKEFSVKDLQYASKRYLSIEGLRQANIAVANGTLRARNKELWGTGTACIGDSKHFSALDQNLRARWHGRYHKHGIMIYWHVDSKHLCIYSQLKSPLSSEVASMMQGVIHHCTDKEVKEAHSDTHGQSFVAFGFSRLLGFELKPRLKGIGRQKLYRHDTTAIFPNLPGVVSTRAIDWELIKQQYDQMVKYATAIRLGTADAESILRRFTRNNSQHPTYRAFMELGKVIRTIFLCEYLSSREVRQEINAALNVVENWNGANDFVFFARDGKFSSNDSGQQEISMLCLQLAQNSMVYVNTLLIQKVLAREHWKGKLSMRDLKALSPLIWEHITPFGKFEIDMNKRLPLD